MEKLRDFNEKSFLNIEELEDDWDFDEEDDDWDFDEEDTETEELLTYDNVVQLLKKNDPQFDSEIWLNALFDQKKEEYLTNTSWLCEMYEYLSIPELSEDYIQLILENIFDRYCITYPDWFAIIESFNTIGFEFYLDYGFPNYSFSLFEDLMYQYEIMEHSSNYLKIISDFLKRFKDDLQNQFEQETLNFLTSHKVVNFLVSIEMIDEALEIITPYWEKLIENYRAGKLPEEIINFLEDFFIQTNMFSQLSSETILIKISDKISMNDSPILPLIKAVVEAHIVSYTNIQDFLAEQCLCFDSYIEEEIQARKKHEYFIHLIDFLKNNH